MKNPGVFPTIDKEALNLDLHTDFDTFFNHGSAEHDRFTELEMERLVQAGYLMKFSSYDACATFLGAPPVLSQLGLITKQNN
eukprot:6456525-Amphidinium_carterae.1